MSETVVSCLQNLPSSTTTNYFWWYSLTFYSFWLMFLDYISISFAATDRVWVASCPFYGIFMAFQRYFAVGHGYYMHRRKCHQISLHGYHDASLNCVKLQQITCDNLKFPVLFSTNNNEVSKWNKLLGNIMEQHIKFEISLILRKKPVSSSFPKIYFSVIINCLLSKLLFHKADKSF